MKHLKKFESLEKLKKEKLLLSDKDFKQAADEFEEIMDCFLEITDKGYEIFFQNSYGHGITQMSYQDYLDQNENYQEFIHGTKSKVGIELGFEVLIRFEFDYKRSVEVQTIFISIINKLNHLNYILHESKAVSRLNTFTLNHSIIEYKFIQKKYL